jgi:hypothetical protein
MTNATNSEPVIICPSCHTSIKLNEQLAAPLVASTRLKYEQMLAQQKAQSAQREQDVAAREAQLARDREQLDEQLAERVKAARVTIEAEAAKRARLTIATEMDQKAKELAEMQALVAARDQQLAEASKAQAELRRKQHELDAQRAQLELTIEERSQAAAATAREAAKVEAKRDFERALAEQVSERDQQLVALNDTLKAREEKLAEALNAQAKVLEKERALDDARRELELDVQKRVTAAVEDVRLKAQRDAEDAIGLKVQEKQLTIDSLTRHVEDLKRKLEQGSQQAQGEALELKLEALLVEKFPHDTMLPIPKGEYGGDIRQQVVMPTGAACGTILWESKRTKNWVDGWLPKLRDDQRAAKADIAVIVSATLPKGVETFDLVDGVWVVHPRAILPVAMALRHSLIEVNCARQASVGQQTKMELVYQYLTGANFRRRIEAIVEAFTTMEEDLAKEKKAITAQWAKREKQLARVFDATSGMYGDLQGIAGKSLSEIAGLALPLGGGSDDEPEARALAVN